LIYRLFIVDGADRSNFPVSSDVSSRVDAYQLFRPTAAAVAATGADGTE